MRKAILYIAASMDQYIAKPDHSMDWLEDPKYFLENVDYGYAELMERIDTTIMGRKTFDFVQSYDGPFPYPNTRNIVYTNNKELETTLPVEFFTGDVVEHLKSLKAQEGKDIWLIGGGTLCSLFLDAGLIDEINLCTVPVMLGQGIPLFPNKCCTEDWHLVMSMNYENGFIQTIYRKV